MAKDRKRKGQQKLVGIYSRKYTKVCDECGKAFSTFAYDMQNYVYKVKSKKKTAIMCSWGCYRKYKARKDEQGN